MFNIEVYVIKYQNENLVLTVSLLGAEKVSLNKGWEEYLHQSDQYWQVLPFSFPNVGRLKNGYTYIENLNTEFLRSNF